MVKLRKVRDDAKAFGYERAEQIDEGIEELYDALHKYLPKNRQCLSHCGKRTHPDSGESGDESARHNRSEGPRKKVSGQSLASAMESSTARGAGHQCQASMPLSVITQMVDYPHTFHSWSYKVPAELRILRALSFDCIDSREDSIQDADAGTFGWLLDEPAGQDLESHMATARQSLLQWLSAGQGIYHISGRPGSGKSTLLKFMANHARTRSELEKWASPLDLITMSFYFWGSGTRMQTSWTGFLRSILLQFLKNCAMETRHFFHGAYTALTHFPGQDHDISSLVDAKAISEAWELLCAKVDPEYCICIFIDGLDEYAVKNADEYDAKKAPDDLRFFEYLQHICQVNQNIKLYVSSRPSPQIDEVIDPNQRMDLHDLAFRDIRTAASSALLAMANDTKLTKEEEQLVATIAEKSQGIFVWAKTVLRNIQAMVTSLGPLRDSEVAKFVSKAVSAYPHDIYDLYDHLLSQVDSRQKSMTALMFGLVLGNPFDEPPNAMWFYWAGQLVQDPDFPGKSDSTPCTDPYTAAQVRTAHDSVQEALVNLTKAMLMMHKDRRHPEDGDQFYRYRVQFSHRTARDFFRYLRAQTHLNILDASVLKLVG